MKRLLPCLAIIVLLPWFWATLSADAAGKDNQQAAVSPKAAAAATPANGNVGSEVCATCHADIASKFSTNPHAQLALLHGGKGVTCESCHGPGEAHVASGGDVTKIVQLNKLPAKKLDATCLGCHESVHPNFERSPHAKAAVSCISCHSVHKSTSEASLLKASEPMLCYGCHSDVKGTFAMPFHHPVPEGAVSCSDCHD
jgi:DmsE family decaheme c-type cytochrome